MKYATDDVAKQKSEVCTGIEEVKVLFPTSLNVFQAFFRNLLDFLKVVRMVFWSGVVGPGFRSLARSRFALGARTIALCAHCRATRSKARLVSKSSNLFVMIFFAFLKVSFSY